MRRSRVISPSLASASAIAAPTLSQLHRTRLRPSLRLKQVHTRSQSQSRSRSRSRSRKHCLNFIGLIVVVSAIGSLFPVVLGTTTAAAAATSTIESEQPNNNNNSNTENSFYFDEYNNNSRTISFIGASATATSSAVFPMTSLDQLSTTTGRTVNASMKAELAGSTTIRSSNTSQSDPATATTKSATSTTSLSIATTTTKSARSTAKQPNDSARSRNHWTYGGTGDAERSRTFRNKFHHENHYGPFFEEPSNQIDPGKTLVSAVHLFTEAVLNCRVGMLKDKTVMWVRRTTEKVSLLTVGNVTYSGDPRIRVKFQYPNNWRLLINPTQREDAGIYMCQVSTHPPRVFTTNLTILEPPLRIIDEHERDVGDRYYKSGSTVDLQCQISRNFYLKEHDSIFKSVEPTIAKPLKLNETSEKNLHLNLNLIGDANQTHLTYSSQELEKHFNSFISWAKDEEPLHAQTNRRFSISDMWLTSRISIPDAKLSDSGNYSCSLGRLFTVIVQVQVLTGELPAAVQHNLARRAASCSASSWSLFLVVICFYVLSSQFQNIRY